MKRLKNYNIAVIRFYFYYPGGGSALSDLTNAGHPNQSGADKDGVKHCQSDPAAGERCVAGFTADVKNSRRKSLGW